MILPSATTIQHGKFEFYLPHHQTSRSPTFRDSRGAARETHHRSLQSTPGDLWLTVPPARDLLAARTRADRPHQPGNGRLSCRQSHHHRGQPAEGGLTSKINLIRLLCEIFLLPTIPNPTHPLQQLGGRATQGSATQATSTHVIQTPYATDPKPPSRDYPSGLP